MDKVIHNNLLIQRESFCLHFLFLNDWHIFVTTQPDMPIRSNQFIIAPFHLGPSRQKVQRRTNCPPRTLSTQRVKARGARATLVAQGVLKCVFNVSDFNAMADR